VLWQGAREDQGVAVSEKDVYSSTKTAMASYVRGLTAEQLATICQACPDWTLQDTLAHHIHVQRCLVDGTFPTAPLTSLVEPETQARSAAIAERDSWTDSGVQQRRDHTLEDLLAEWDEVEAQTPESGTALADLSAHFDDIRETIEGNHHRSGDDISLSMTRLHQLQTMRLAAAGAEPVNLRCTDIDLELTADDSTSTVSGGSYELLRCMFSRRSHADADAQLDWGTSSAASRELFAVYDWPTR